MGRLGWLFLEGSRMPRLWWESCAGPVAALPAVLSCRTGSDQ